MSRKVSVDSAGDGWTDDLLRVLYDLAFRQRSAWGWLAAAAFAVVPVSISYLCWADGNVICAAVFIGIATLIVVLRIICTRGALATDTFQAYEESKEAG